MRAVAAALALLALAVTAASGQSGAQQRLAFLRDGNLVVVDPSTKSETVVLRNGGNGPVAWSGDGTRVSSGGKVADGPALPTARIAWAPFGETAAYVTQRGGVVIWSPIAGRRDVVPNGWGAQTIAWNSGGALALGRAVCDGACGRPIHKEVWVWDRGSLRRIVGPLPGDQTPMPFAWLSGRVLWWDWPDSGSIAADGVDVYSNTRKLATALMYRDYVAVCGVHVAIAAGNDRYATHGKRILFDGRDVSRDSSRSWVSPACSTDGSTLVAAAGRNWEEPRIGSGEHRAVWQLLPTRRRLTSPPSGWTDENPRVLADGSVLFVRTHQTTQKVHGAWHETDHARLELLRSETVTTIADLTYTASELSGAFLNYYGHYDWPSRLAVSP